MFRIASSLSVRVVRVVHALRAIRAVRGSAGAGRTHRPRSSVVLAGLVALALAVVSPPLEARRWIGSTVAVDTIPVGALPIEGRQVLAAIRAGGPFVSRRDGIVFGNREGVLPREPRGYYAEFTVPTPGVRNRGARRIIAGQGTTGDVRTSDEYYYTNDHYQSFRRIVP